jgi:hypothetical protein
MLDTVPNRIAEVTELLSSILVPHAPLRVVVAGAGADAFAGALAGHPGLSVGVTAPADVTIYLRTSRGGDGESDADIVIDHHDPQWPVIRRVSAALADPELWYLSESRAFFGVRAATWDAKFGDDLPAYARAVSAAGGLTTFHPSIRPAAPRWPPGTAVRCGRTSRASGRCSPVPVGA